MFVREAGRTLRCGFTTGSAAAMSALASARLLTGTGNRSDTVAIMTPGGVMVEAGIELSELYEGGECPDISTEAAGEQRACGRYAVCGVRKDGGDDKDVTHGLLICAKTEFAGTSEDEPGVVIEAGEGIGIVTKPGLSVPVGQPAINPVPRKMIGDAVLQALKEAGLNRTIKCTIYVPEGRRAARSTFNERLGVVGGISIIGTSGIVEPMSRKAFSDSVCLEIRQQAALGERRLILTPGNYGEAFLKELRGDGRLKGVLDGEMSGAPSVMCSNFIGAAIDEAIAGDFERVLIIGHAGKLLKLAGGIMDTHSRTADCRMELICAHAAINGADTGICRRIMESVTTDAVFSWLREEDASLCEKITASMLAAVKYHLDERVRKNEKESNIRLGAIVFTSEGGKNCLLGATPGISD